MAIDTHDIKVRLLVFLLILIAFFIPYIIIIIWIEIKYIVFFLTGLGCILIGLAVYLYVSNKVIKYLNKKGLLEKNKKEV